MAREDKKGDEGGHWFLRAGPDTVYGELTLAALASWAEQGRVTAKSEISNNGQDWVLAETVPELKMDWLVTLKSGAHYGPLNLLAVPVLFRRGFIDAAAVLENKITHRKVPAAALLRGVTQQPSDETESETESQQAPTLLAPLPPAPAADVSLPRPKRPEVGVATPSVTPPREPAVPVSPASPPLPSERERQLARLLEQANASLTQLRAQQANAAGLRDRMAEETKGKVEHLERENEALQRSLKANESDLTRRISELQAKLREAEQQRERVRLDAVAPQAEVSPSTDVKASELTRALAALQAASKALRQDLERERQAHVQTRQQLRGAESEAKRLAGELRAKPEVAGGVLPKSAVEAVERIKRELATATASAAAQARERQIAYDAAVSALQAQLNELKQQLSARADEHRLELDAVKEQQAAALKRMADERAASEQKLQSALEEAQASAHQREETLTAEAATLKALLAAAQDQAAAARACAAEQESALQTLRAAMDAERERQKGLETRLSARHQEEGAEAEARAREVAQREAALTAEIQIQRNAAEQASARVKELESQAVSLQALQEQALATHEQALQSLRAEHDATLARMRRESEAASAELVRREAEAAQEREALVLAANQESAALREALEKIREEASANELALTSARTELGSLREQLAARTAEYAVATERLELELTQTRSRMEMGDQARQDADHKRVALLEHEVSELQARLAKASAESTQWVQQLESLEAELAATKDAAAAQASEQDAARKALSVEHAQAISRLGAAREAMEDELRQRLALVAQANDTQLESLHAEIHRLQDALSVALADAETRLQRAVQAEAQLADLQSTLAEHESLNAASAERDRSIEGLSRDLAAARDRLRDAQREHQQEVEALRAKLAEEQAVVLREREALIRDHQDRLASQAEALRLAREDAATELRTQRESLETALAESEDRGKAIESLQGEIAALQDLKAKGEAASRQEIKRLRDALQAAEADFDARMAEAVNAAAIREGALQREVESLGQALALAREDAAVAAKRVGELERERTLAEVGHEKALVAVQSRLAKSAEVMTARIEALKAKSKEQQTASASRIQALRTELRDTKKSASALTRDAAAYQKRVEALAAELQAARAERAESEAAHAKTLQALESLQLSMHNERSTLEVAMSGEVAKVEAQRQALGDALELLRAESAAREAELSEELERQRAAGGSAQEQIAALESQLSTATASARESSAAHAESVKRLEAEVAERTAALKAAAAREAELSEELEKQRAAGGSAQEQIAALESQLSTATASVRESSATHAESVKRLEAEVAERTAALKAAVARETKLSEELETQRDEWVESTERADAAAARISQLESELANVRSQAEQAAATIATLQTAQREASGREQALESDLAGLRVELQAARDQHAREIEQTRAAHLAALTAGETRLAEAQEALTQAQAEAKRRAEMVEFLRTQIVRLKEMQSGQDEAVLLLKREMAELAAARQRGAESEEAAELRIRELAAALEEARVGADMQSRKLKALEESLRRRDAVPVASIGELEAQVAALRAECDALRASRDEEIQSRQLAIEQRESAWQSRLKAAEQAVEETREAVLADRQRELNAVREALGPLAAMAQQLSKRSDPDATELVSRWFLRPGGGDVLGPVALRDLVTWAEECRIGPDAELSSDGEQWTPATQLAPLHLEWMVPLVDGGRFGPVNLKSIQHLIADGVVVADGEIEHVDGHRRGSFAQMLMAEADQALDEARRLDQGLVAYQRTAVSLHSGLQALDVQLASRA